MIQKPLPRLVLPALNGVSAVSASQSTILTLLRTFEFIWLTRLDLRGSRSIFVAANPALTLDRLVAMSPKSLFPRLILQRGVVCGEYERSWVTMPLKDYKEVNVCFMTSDGTKLCSMDEIPELHIDSVPIADEDQKMLVALREPVELSFSFDMPVPPRELIFAMCV